MLARASIRAGAPTSLPARRTATPLYGGGKRFRSTGRCAVASPACRVAMRARSTTGGEDRGDSNVSSPLITRAPRHAPSSETLHDVHRGPAAAAAIHLYAAAAPTHGSIIERDTAIATQPNKLNNALPLKAAVAAAPPPPPPPPKIITLLGASRQAARMRQQVTAATQLRGAVLVTGELGLHKASVAAAALGAAASGGGGAPFAERLDAATAPPERVERLLNRLLRGDGDVVLGGAVLLTNVHMLSDAHARLLRDVLVEQRAILASEGSSLPPPSGGGGHALARTRILLTSAASAAVPALLDGAVESTIAVAPLRARPSDIKEIASRLLERFGRNGDADSAPAADCSGHGGDGECCHGGDHGRAVCGCGSAAERGGAPRSTATMQLSTAALAKLCSYAFPGNLLELEGMLVQAVARRAQNDSGRGAAAATLEAADFWQATADADRGRVDVLEVAPWLRGPLLGGWWAEGINANFTRWAFAAVLALLFLGPQDREHNAALTVFWAGWWPATFLSYPLVGRAWCSVCPFMVTGEAVGDLRDTGSCSSGSSSGAATLTAAAGSLSSYDVQQPQQQAAAPPAAARGSWAAHKLAPLSGGALVTLFAAILVWEEVCSLPNNATLSAALLLLITGGATLFSWSFDKRAWCLHLCPIGGMNGIFSKLACTEIRSRPGVCTANACARPCIHGTPAPAAATLSAMPPAAAATTLPHHDHPHEHHHHQQQQSIPGCPVGTGPGRNKDNSHCISCLLCMRNCPNDSVQLRLRVPGLDLWTTTEPRMSEVLLLFVLVGAVLLHRLPQVADQLGVPLGAIVASQPAHIVVSALMLAAPGAVALAAHLAGASLAQAAATSAPVDADAAPSTSSMMMPSFLKLAYSYVPLTWAATLAHYEAPMLLELGQLLPRAAATVGVPDALAAALPALAAPMPVVHAVQGATLLAGAAGSAVLCSMLSGSLAAAAAAERAPAVRGAALATQLVIGALTAEMFHLVLGGAGASLI